MVVAKKIYSSSLYIYLRVGRQLSLAHQSNLLTTKREAIKEELRNMSSSSRRLLCWQLRHRFKQLVIPQI